MAYPYGNETPLTSGVNAIVGALGGDEVTYPYGDETPLTAGVNAILEAIAAGGGGGGGGGADGYSPTVTIETITGGHRVTITDVNGPHSFDVMDGDDYTLTNLYKQDSATLVAAMFTNGDSASY